MSVRARRRPGAALGFRVWAQFKIAGRDSLRGWVPGVTRAGCNRLTHPAHTPPDPRCGCGLHAYGYPILSSGDRTVLPGDLSAGLSSVGMMCGDWAVGAVVRGWGRLLEGHRVREPYRDLHPADARLHRNRKWEAEIVRRFDPRWRAWRSRFGEILVFYPAPAGDTIDRRLREIGDCYSVPVLTTPEIVAVVDEYAAAGRLPELAEEGWPCP